MLHTARENLQLAEGCRNHSQDKTQTRLLRKSSGHQQQMNEGRLSGAARTPSAKLRRRPAPLTGTAGWAAAERGDSGRAPSAAPAAGTGPRSRPAQWGEGSPRPTTDTPARRATTKLRHRLGNSSSLPAPGPGPTARPRRRRPGRPVPPLPPAAHQLLEVLLGEPGVAVPLLLELVPRCLHHHRHPRRPEPAARRPQPAVAPPPRQARPAPPRRRRLPLCGRAAGGGAGPAEGAAGTAEQRQPQQGGGSRRRPLAEQQGTAGGRPAGEAEAAVEEAPRGGHSPGSVARSPRGAGAGQRAGGSGAALPGGGCPRSEAASAPRQRSAHMARPRRGAPPRAQAPPPPIRKRAARHPPVAGAGQERRGALPGRARRRLRMRLSPPTAPARGREGRRGQRVSSAPRPAPREHELRMRLALGRSRFHSHTPPLPAACILAGPAGATGLQARRPARALLSAPVAVRGRVPSGVRPGSPAPKGRALCRLSLSFLLRWRFVK